MASLFDALVSVEGCLTGRFASSSTRRSSQCWPCSRRDQLDDYITDKNIHIATDEDCREQVSCFGVGWDPFDGTCQGCAAQARCLYAVSHRYLPQLALELGLSEVQNATTQAPLVAQLDANEVAAGAGSHPAAVHYAKSVYSNSAFGLPILDSSGQLQPSMQGPPQGPSGSGAAMAGGSSVLVTDAVVIEAASVTHDVTEGQELDLSPEYAEEATGAEVEAVLQNIADSAVGAFAADAMPQLEDDESAGKEEKEETVPVSKKKAPTKKTVTKKKVTRKTSPAKTVTKKKVAKKAPALKAPTAVSKETPAKKKKAPALKKATAKKASAKTGPTSPPKAKALGGAADPTFQKRFDRCLRLPHIAALKYGQVLTRVQKDGSTHRVTFTKAGFKFNGQLYPTLYAVQLEIEGHPKIGGKVQGSMSTKRFFGLDKKS